MLVLTRKKNEAIIVTTPDGIEVDIIVVEIRGDKVRLGISAPLDFVVDRMEVAMAKKREAVNAVVKELLSPPENEPDLKGGAE